MNKLKITVLVENTAGGKALLAEHGFSLWLEYGDKKVLFDTGQGYVLKNNAAQLSIDLEAADAMILSHGHYDHTGGMEKIKKINTIKIFTHKDSLLPKYSKHRDGSVHAIGMKPLNGNNLNYKFNDKAVELYKGFHLTGTVPRINDFENTGGQFFCDKECRKVDNLLDDQTAFIETPAGLVVILGCAHSGVINTLEYISSLTGSRSIHTLVGGMHLGSASKERMDKTIAGLKKFDIQNLYPAHCTGFKASARILQEFPRICKPCKTGTIIEIYKSKPLGLKS